MRKVLSFFSSGINTLSAASKGNYSERTDDVCRIRDEMLNGNHSSFRSDKRNRLMDKKAIGVDLRKAFNSVSKF